MYNKIKKVPAGMLLIPMFLSALVNTFAPGLFNIGGVSEAFFTSAGTNYIIGAICFCSGAGIDIKELGPIIKKYGVLMLVKTIICIAIGTFYIQVFGLSGIWGISAVALIAVICSTNPSLFIALMQDYNKKLDAGAFGLIGLFCVPAYPIFVYSISRAAEINWMPIISTFLPLLAGLIIGNLDKNFSKLFASAVAPLIPFMGWIFGSSVNIFDAFRSALTGSILVIVFYIALIPIMLSVERYFLKDDGLATLAVSSVAGMSVSVPAVLASTTPEVADFLAPATAQIAFAVVITSILTPYFAKKLMNRVGHKPNSRQVESTQ